METQLAPTSVAPGIMSVYLVWVRVDYAAFISPQEVIGLLLEEISVD